MTAPGTPSPTSRRNEWVLIAILFLASIVSVIDRGILNLVVDPVKTDLGLTDVQISLLQGLAFGLFYATVGIPLGLAADRVSRRWLIIGGVTMWSVATVGGGLAQSYGALFASRVLVGLGEAALSPAAISLIADLFPPQSRGRPIGIFLTGQAIANGLAISVTSAVLAGAAAGKFAAVPLLAALAAWRIAFVCCGLAGFVVVAALLTTREPARHSGPPRSAGTGGFGYLARNAPVFVPMYLGFALCFLAVYGTAAWAPTMLVRSFGATSTAIGGLLGPLSMLAGVAGPAIGGTLVDFFARRGVTLAKPAILAAAPLFVIPSALAVFAPGVTGAIILIASGGIAVAVIGTTMIAALQAMVPSTMHGLAVALTGFVNTILGATSGPYLIAALTEHGYRDPAMLGHAIPLVVVPALITGSALFAVTGLALRSQWHASGEVAIVMRRNAGTTLVRTPDIKRVNLPAGFDLDNVRSEGS